MPLTAPGESARRGGYTLLLRRLLLAASAVVLLGAVAAAAADAADDDAVTCGSAVKLRHRSTGYYLSSEPKNLNAGSGQQIVTFVPANGGGASSTDTLWWVRGPNEAPEECAPGTAIECGAVVRLTHLNTRRNLHSHRGVPAPLSGGSATQEVSAYGQGDGRGDAGDNFRVLCAGGGSGSGPWRRRAAVRLQHVDTGRVLGTSRRAEFNAQTCGHHCPIMGHLEAAARDSGSGDDAFGGLVVDQGVHLSK